MDISTSFFTVVYHASLMAQMVKSLPAMWETWVQSLGCEDALEEGMAIHSSVLAWRIPMDRGAWRAAAHGVAKGQTWLSDNVHVHMVYHAVLDTAPHAVQRDLAVYDEILLGDF